MGEHQKPLDAQKVAKANVIFEEARKRFLAWLDSRPSGGFTLFIPVNQGGIRKHKYRVDEDG